MLPYVWPWSSYTLQPKQEAPLSPRDRVIRRVSWNLANCHATVQKLLVRNAASSYWCPRHTSRAPSDSHDIVITRAVCVPRLIAGAHVVRCCLVHRLMTKSTHVHRASCACVLCCRFGSGFGGPWGLRTLGMAGRYRAVVVYVIQSVRLSVCHKSVLGPMSKLVDVRSRKQRCIIAQLGNLGFWFQKILTKFKRGHSWRERQMQVGCRRLCILSA